jgi:thiol-disulfide isomerase/thioredoxin
VAVLPPGNALPALSLTDGRGGAAAPPPGEILLGFFKTTCPTCELAWPFLDRIGRMGAGGALAVVAVSQDGPEETARFNESLGVTLPTLFDPDPWNASRVLGLSIVPTLLRISAGAMLRETVVGFQKQKMQEFGEEAAQLAGRTFEELFRPGESVPSIKPG